MADIFAMGFAVHDTLLLADDFPVEDSRLRISDTFEQRGGQASTALAAAAKLGASCAFIGCVGDDISGDYIISQLISHGIDVKSTKKIAGTTSNRSFVLVNRSKATRTCMSTRGTAPAPSDEMIINAGLERAKIFHTDGHYAEAALKAAKIVHENGGKVCMDAGGFYDGVEDVLKIADFIIASQEFSQKLTGKDDEREAVKALFDAYHPEFAMITLGARGGIYYDGKNFDSYEAYQVNAVDSNGAGDIFHGAWIAAYLNGMTAMAAARFAAAVSAIKCQKLGTRGNLPTWEETQAWIGEYGK